MARILAEAQRQTKRLLLRHSHSLCLAFDDRAGYKLVTYKASCTGVPKHLAASQGLAVPDKGLCVTTGILGCVQCLRGSSLNNFAEDYAVRAGAEVLRMIANFCTPLGEAMDDALRRHILASVRALVADGQLQKLAAWLRQEAMPNCVLIHRDPAHMVRIACKDPLVRTGQFEQQHARLFTERHALLKNIQFSDSLQARLEACQTEVLRHRGAQGGGVRHIMRHFSLAPHRFESWVSPRRAYACTLHAVALLLADIAGDVREKKPTRLRAEEALHAMQPARLLEVGIAADFGEICMRFIDLVASISLRGCMEWHPAQWGGGFR